ncbi:MAG: di-trans,poly-cis-decaprenylcistransferase [Clostridiales bacterium]|jgi:undecaprenyl diphosphate synthase|nr:di-trans,poly-cis-decaprenylcistransferase [Clostridiales bacterium]
MAGIIRALRQWLRRPRKKNGLPHGAGAGAGAGANAESPPPGADAPAALTAAGTAALPGGGAKAAPGSGAGAAPGGKGKSAPKGAVLPLPPHIAIIMDGNGRWAKRRALPRSLGHRAGAETLKRITRHCKNIGVSYLTVYAFSTENWNRPKAEVQGIVALLADYMATFDQDPENGSIRVRYIGDISAFGEELAEGLGRIAEKTRLNADAITLTIALNYGGRAAIAAAAREAAAQAASGAMDPGELDVAGFGRLLNPDGIPDPDLLIRPGAEKRISNFLLWELAYAELWFTDVLWPDISERDIDEAIESYGKRQRRFGGLANDG